MIPILLQITGVGNIKSLKNNKMVPLRGRAILTKPDAWKQQKKIVDQIESQLYYALGISADMTLMEQRAQFLTVSSELVEELLTCMPEDDNYKIIPDTRKLSVNVKKGDEGAIVYIDSSKPSKLVKEDNTFTEVLDKFIEIVNVKDNFDPYYN